MRINENTKIVGDRVVLVPYCRHHVATYHEWMSRSEIQELTASEPLSMDEEYEMQARWQYDEDKLTFIVLRKDVYQQAATTGHEQEQEQEIKAMIGDVNCFFIDENDDDDEEHGSQNGAKQAAELEIMIVDEANRGCGYGSEAVFLMIVYCFKHLCARFNRFLVKIGEYNLPSICMFEKLGFVKYKKMEPFKQVCLRLNLDVFEHNVQSIDFSSQRRFKFSRDNQINVQSYK